MPCRVDEAAIAERCGQDDDQQANGSSPTCRAGGRFRQRQQPHMPPASDADFGPLAAREPVHASGPLRPVHRSQANSLRGKTSRSRCPQKRRDGEGYGAETNRPRMIPRVKVNNVHIYTTQGGSRPQVVLVQTSNLHLQDQARPPPVAAEWHSAASSAASSRCR